MKKKIIFLCLAALTTTMCIPAIPAQAAASASTALTKAKAIAKDDSHGYSSSNRWGNPDYDCSAFVISAFEKAGIDTNGAVYTGNMKSTLTKAGFTYYSSSQLSMTTGYSKLKAGDILWKDGCHTEIYAGSGKQVGAHKDYDGKSGDSTGKEISVTSYKKSYGWTGVFRYTGSSSSSSSNSSTTTTSDSEADYPTGTYQVTAESLNVRSKASITSSKLGIVSKGDTYSVSATSGRWGRITYKGQTAWISLAYCTKVSTTSVTTVQATSLTGTKSKKHAIKCYWNQVSGVSGYRIYYKEVKTSGYKKKDVSATKYKKKIKKLSSGTKYRIKIRA